ncbi:hypothetical protein VKT23_008220 [Stygiomarasmius scandens]|uniref:Uncharacterized protein n=1 Tax=Marasmiellus scandens TaxID=2682957 RepID=A0ABR1JKD8_9AGAR
MLDCHTVITPHIPSLSSPSCQSPPITYTSHAFPSLTPLLDTLQQANQTPTPSPYLNDHHTLISVSNSPLHHHPSHLNSHLPFIDPQPSVCYDFTTPYTPPPVPPSRSVLLSPLHLPFDRRSDISCTPYTVDLNEDLNQSPQSPLPAPQPSHRAYMETVYSLSGGSPSIPGVNSPLQPSSHTISPILPVPTPISTHTRHLSHDVPAWLSSRHTSVLAGSLSHLEFGGVPLHSARHSSSPQYQLLGYLGHGPQVTPLHSGGVNTPLLSWSNYVLDQMT